MDMDPDESLRAACAQLRDGVAGAARAACAALEAGADPRGNSREALYLACATGELEMLNKLFAAGLTVDDVRALQTNALRIACAQGQLAVVNRLLRTGITPEDARAGNCEALGRACMFGHVGVVEQLFEFGLCEGDALRCSEAVASAVRSGHQGVVAAMVMNGSRPEPPTLSMAARSERVARAVVTRWNGTPELDAAENNLSVEDRPLWAEAKAQLWA
jgi:hypothetical protein